MISARKAKHDATTMFTYSHANTPLSQSERAYYLSYFINGNAVFTVFSKILKVQPFRIRKKVSKSFGRDDPHIR